MNRIILIGRLTRDPELRYTGSGKAVANFTLAVNRPFTSQDGAREADFIDVVVWQRQAENVAKYLAKGRQAAVEGRLQIRSYEAQDGSRRYRAEVVADRIEFIGGGGQGGASGAPTQNHQPMEYDAGPQMDGGFGEEVVFSSEDDLPF